MSTGVVGAMMSDSLSGKVIAMWGPIMLFFYMGFTFVGLIIYLTHARTRPHRLIQHADNS